MKPNNGIPQTFNIAVNPDDFVQCECGSFFMTPIFRIAVPRTPMIGGERQLAFVQHMKCDECGNILNLDQVKPIRENVGITVGN